MRVNALRFVSVPTLSRWILNNLTARYSSGRHHHMADDAWYRTAPVVVCGCSQSCPTESLNAGCLRGSLLRGLCPSIHSRVERSGISKRSDLLSSLCCTHYCPPVTLMLGTCASLCWRHSTLRVFRSSARCHFLQNQSPKSSLGSPACLCSPIWRQRRLGSWWAGHNMWSVARFAGHWHCVAGKHIFQQV